MGKRRYVIAALLAGTMGMIAPSQAWAQDGQAYPFDMPSQDLGDALRNVAARAGWELYAQTDDLNGKAAPALRGSAPAAAIPVPRRPALPRGGSIRRRCR